MWRDKALGLNTIWNISNALIIDWSARCVGIALLELFYWACLLQWKQSSMASVFELFGMIFVPRTDVMSFYLRSVQTFSVPSRGLMIPGISSPNDRWSMRWEKLYAVINNKSEQSLTPGLWISSGLNVLTQLKTSHSSIITYICLGCFYVSCMGVKL